MRAEECEHPSHAMRKVGRRYRRRRDGQKTNLFWFTCVQCGKRWKRDLLDRQSNWKTNIAKYDIMGYGIYMNCSHETILQRRPEYAQEQVRICGRDYETATVQTKRFFTVALYYQFGLTEDHAYPTETIPPELIAEEEAYPRQPLMSDSDDKDDL